MRRALGAVVVAVWFFAELSVPAAAADPDLSDMNERLVRSAILRADFHQEKTLQALSRPLVSRGKLVFAAGEGVLWQVLEPYVVYVLIKPDEVVEWGTQGGKRRADAGSNPLFRALTNMILAILSGDAQVLRQYFELSPDPSDVGWRLTLRPRSQELGAVVSTVEVFGDQFVEEVRILEAKGDTTTIRFSGFSVEPAELDEIEKIYFAQ